MLTSYPSGQFGCYAVKVRAKAEASITQTLRLKGFQVLLPTYIHRRRYADRLKKTSRALFPGYVFVRLHPEQTLGVVSTEGVSYIVKSGSTLQALPPSEELLLHSLTALPDHCEPCGANPVGHRVQVRSGPLKDQHGTLVQVGDKECLVLSIDSISSSVSVDLGDAAVERFGE